VLLIGQAMLRPVSASDLFVDQKHPAASDNNPGTEARPFKTIQPAVNLVRPGETVFVKAGLYEDLVTLNGYGKPGAPKTLTAWKDDRVVIGSRLCDLPAAERWQPIPGRKSWQVQLDEGAPVDLIVILDGRAIVTQFKDQPPADDKLNWATYRRGDRMPAFFWRVASGNYDPNDLTRWRGYDYEGAWQPDCDAGYDLGDNHGATWYVGAEDRYPDPKFSNPPANRASQSSGNRWLVMKCVKPENMPPSGVGWWTPWLATAPGAQTTVSLKICGKAIEPTGKGTPAVYVQFIGPTGQQMTRTFLIGRDAAGALHRPELTKGSYPWTEVSETVTAPETAVRMALFLGIQPCKGELGFDDINIKTADGEKSASEMEVAEVLPARIARERLREIVYLDLSKVANRALAYEPAGGSRGWTGQGPELDMRNLKTGDHSFGGVPFRISTAAKAAIILKGNGKAGADLPQEVTMPVGRKLEALYILHANAFLDQPAEPPRGPVFEVSAAFADGTVSTWQAWPRVLADWLAPAVREFPEDYPPTQTTAVLTVPVGKTARGTIYRTEWIFDRTKHTVPVKSITLRGTDRGVAIILGLTGATQW
jgi:hypothetical protein